MFFYIFWLGASLISAYFLEIHPCAEELFLTHKDGFKMVSESKLLFDFWVFLCVCVRFRYVPGGSECQVSLKILLGTMCRVRLPL